MHIPLPLSILSKVIGSVSSVLFSHDLQKPPGQLNGKVSQVQLGSSQSILLEELNLLEELDLREELDLVEELDLREELSL